METCVNTIAALASKLIARDDLVNFFETAENSQNITLSDDAKLMLTSVGLAAQEVAEEYFPLEAEESVLSNEDCRILFSTLSNKVHRILAIYDATGRSCTFHTFDGFAKVDSPNASYTIYYEKVPDFADINEDIEHSAKVSERVLAYGACSHFCLCSLLYEEAKMWNAKYADALDSLRILYSRRKSVRKNWHI